MRTQVVNMPFYVMIEREPLKPDKGFKKRETYSKLVTVEKAMNLINGKPNYATGVDGIKMVTHRTPLSRRFDLRR